MHSLGRKYRKRIRRKKSRRSKQGLCGGKVLPQSEVCILIYPRAPVKRTTIYNPILEVERRYVRYVR